MNDNLQKLIIAGFLILMVLVIGYSMVPKIQKAFNFDVQVAQSIR